MLKTGVFTENGIVKNYKQTDILFNDNFYSYVFV